MVAALDSAMNRIVVNPKIATGRKIAGVEILSYTGMC